MTRPTSERPTDHDCYRWLELDDEYAGLRIHAWTTGGRPGELRKRVDWVMDMIEDALRTGDLVCGDARRWLAIAQVAYRHIFGEAK